MEKRTIYELLLILKKSIEEAEEIKGLCWQIYVVRSAGLISYEEMPLLDKYINSVKPFDVGNGYWWPVGKKKPRLEWLDNELFRVEHFKKIIKTE